MGWHLAKLGAVKFPWEEAGLELASKRGPWVCLSWRLDVGLGMRLCVCEEPGVE